jgi:hypothetical protein
MSTVTGLSFVAALAIASVEPPAEDIVIGPFKIVSTVQEVVSFPYNSVSKETVLSWHSADNKIRYELIDNGIFIHNSITFKHNENNKCSYIAPYIQLKSESTPFFDWNFFSKSVCIGIIPDLRFMVNDVEIAAARVEFAKAYEVFLSATRKQHGSSTARCLEFKFGNHGPICERYSTEDSIDAQDY